MGIDGNVMQQGIIVYMESGLGKILTEKKLKEERKRKERKDEGGEDKCACHWRNKVLILTVRIKYH